MSLLWTNKRFSAAIAREKQTKKDQKHEKLRRVFGINEKEKKAGNEDLTKDERDSIVK